MANPFLAAVGGVAIIFGALGPVSAQGIGGPYRNPSPSELLAILGEPLDGREFVEPQPFGVMVAKIQTIVSQRGKRLPVWINDGAFKEEAAEAPNLADVMVSCRDRGHWPTVGQVLLGLLDHHPDNNATFILRPGVVEITTYDRARPQYRLGTPVMLQVRNRPLGLVLYDLYEQTGVNIIVDPQLSHRLRRPVSAAFASPVELGDALFAVTHGHDLRFIPVGCVVYVTSTKRASRVLTEYSSYRNSLPWFQPLVSAPATPLPANGVADGKIDAEALADANRPRHGVMSVAAVGSPRNEQTASLSHLSGELRNSP